jgi:hypothetical protein
MVRKRKPYDLIYLMTVEFLISILTFYSSVIMIVGVATGSDSDRLELIGPDAPAWVLDDPSQALTIFSIAFMALALLSFLLLWGFLRAKSFSWMTGILASVATTVVGMTAILTLGYEDTQTFFRYLILVIAPMFVIYLLVRQDIKAYLLR